MTCDDLDRSAIQAIKYPCLVVEVLSPSTTGYDSPEVTLCERGDKFRMYRCNPSLQDYLLVDAEKVTIDLYCKNESSDSWEIINYQADDMIKLQSINLS